MDTPRYYNEADVVIAVEHEPGHQRGLGRVRMSVIDRTRGKLDVESPRASLETRWVGGRLAR